MTKNTHSPPRSLPRSYSCRKKFENVYQLHVALQYIEPTIWRCIQVPECYSFWDLHCAITDAFGWLDYHLHLFTIQNPKSGEMDQIGMPDDEGFDKISTLPDYKTGIAAYFSDTNTQCEYWYDFGDDWRHAVTLEQVLPREKGVAYPRCIAGERACPPEDVGGPWGYGDFLKAISNKNAPEDEEEDIDMLEWCGGWFEPEWCDLDLIRFGNPLLRWKIAYQDAEMPESLRTVQYHRMRSGSEEGLSLRIL